MDETTTYFFISLFALFVIVSMALPFSSTDPDGLKKAAQNLGFDDKAEEINTFAPMPDYDATGDGSYAGVLIAGTAGVLATLCLGFGAGHLLKISGEATEK